MTSFKYLQLAIDGSGIAILTLNRPEIHNAFDNAMVQELISAFEQLNQLEAVRIIILKANGKSFSAGADLAWMKCMLNYDRAQNIADAMLLTKLMQTIYTSIKTTIALVHGAVYGGGVGLVACCDIALASVDALFSLSEVKMGLIPAVISPYVLRAIGERQARRYFLTAERFDAKKALAMGLVHEIVETELLIQGYQLGQQILQNPPQALKAAKQLIQIVADQPLDATLFQKTAEMIADLRVSPEAQERLGAFLSRKG